MMTDTVVLDQPREGFEEQAVPATRVRGYWQSVFYRLRHDPVTLAFAAIVLLIVLAAIFAPLIAPFDPYKESIVGRLEPFGWRGHLLGTDELGRDMLSRLIYGGRVSLMMGVMPVLIASLIGGMLGVIGGFLGGRVNTAIMRTMDVFYAFPSVLLAVAIAGAMGGGMGNGMLALTLVFIPPMCRVAETATTQVRALDFIEAARASGARTMTIIRYHVLGNVLGPVFIYASSLISVSILLASGLSFLGLGARPPVPDWGLMLSTLRQSIYVVPLVCALPGAAIFITSMCCNLVSDGLRAAMDVRMWRMSSLNPDPRDRGGPQQPMLIARDLRKHFPVKGSGGKSVQAVDGVSFTVDKGETLGVVCESGCGKSTLARLLLHPLEPDTGELVFDG